MSPPSREFFCTRGGQGTSLVIIKSKREFLLRDVADATNPHLATLLATFWLAAAFLFFATALLLPFLTFCEVIEVVEIPPAFIFLHGWRRHVSRECRGHPALLEGESSLFFCTSGNAMCAEVVRHLVLGRIELLARLREPRKERHKPKTTQTTKENLKVSRRPGWEKQAEPTTEPNNKQTKQQNLAKTRLIGSCRGETTRRKVKQKGHQITQNGLSVHFVHASTFKSQAADLRSVALSLRVPLDMALYLGIQASSLCMHHSGEAWTTNLQVHRLRVRMVGRYASENHCGEKPNCSKKIRFLASSSAAC